MIRRVGLDLDNTIIDYDAVFVDAARRFGHGDGSRSKSEVRERVRASAGDEAWQRIQGWVYGEGIGGAVPYWGVHEFLRRCSTREIEVFIVSHKTERGHFSSPDVSLRSVAIEWLIREGLCGTSVPAIPLDRVHFCADRTEKVRLIANLALDAFVDDLPEVLTDPHFPERTRRIGFRVDPSVTTVESVRSWREVGDSLLGSPNPDEVAGMVATASGIGAVDRVEAAGVGGNSATFVVHTATGRFFMKRYPDRQIDPRRRCETETRALRWMGERGFPVPRLVWADDGLGLAAHGFVDGTSIARPSLDDIELAADFVEGLAVHAERERPDFEGASEHFSSALDLVGQVERRLEVGERSGHGPCAEFFRAELRPAFEREAARIRTTMGDSFDQVLPPESRTLSPSDFGFHNALRTDSGIVFVDFEYFGWDDPAKLVCDFLLHPGFQSTSENRGRWLERTAGIFGSETVDRAISMLPLVAIRWEAIIMRPFVGTQGTFDDDEWTRRLERTNAVRAATLECRK